MENTRKDAIILRLLTRLLLGISGILLVVCTTAFSQVSGQSVEYSNQNSVLQWLPAITFFLSIIMGIVNIWVINKLYKWKEDILGVVRQEFKEKLKDLEEKTASQEQVEFLRTEMQLLLKNIEQKIDSSNRRG